MEEHFLRRVAAAEELVGAEGAAGLRGVRVRHQTGVHLQDWTLRSGLQSFGGKGRHSHVNKGTTVYIYSRGCHIGERKLPRA